MTDSGEMVILAITPVAAPLGVAAFQAATISAMAAAAPATVILVAAVLVVSVGLDRITAQHMTGPSGRSLAGNQGMIKMAPKTNRVANKIFISLNTKMRPTATITRVATPIMAALGEASILG